MWGKDERGLDVLGHKSNFRTVVLNLFDSKDFRYRRPFEGLQNISDPSVKFANFQTCYLLKLLYVMMTRIVNKHGSCWVNKLKWELGLHDIGKN